MWALGDAERITRFIFFFFLVKKDVCKGSIVARRDFDISVYGDGEQFPIFATGTKTTTVSQLYTRNERLLLGNPT